MFRAEPEVAAPAAPGHPPVPLGPGVHAAALVGAFAPVLAVLARRVQVLVERREDCLKAGRVV
jgi:hypothetical protein